MKNAIIRILLLAALGLLVAGGKIPAAGAAGTQTFDPATGFSASQNPAGVWSYGYSTTLGGSLILHETSDTTWGFPSCWRTDIGSGAPALGYNSTSSRITFRTLIIDPRDFVLHPGPSGEYAVLRFTVPAAGTYHAVGSFFGLDTAGTTTDPHVLTNGVSVFDGLVNGFGPGSAIAVDLTVDLLAGDTVDFAVGIGSNFNYSNDSTGFRGTITTGSQRATLMVAGDANIFGAGHAMAPAPGGGSGGTLPPGFDFAAGPGQTITFSSVSGTIIATGTEQDGPDGGEVYSSNLDSTGGVSGLQSDRSFFLAGVFLDGSEPADPAPARLDFRSSELKTDFAALSPALNQTFYIGDGLTGIGNGTRQRFHVPPSATRLFLGFADGNGVVGAPGQYQDNSGALTAAFQLQSQSVSMTPGSVKVPQGGLGAHELALKGYASGRPCGWRNSSI